MSRKKLAPDVKNRFREQASGHPEEPACCVLLELEVLSLPQGMDGVADCREDDPALPVIVRPAGNGLSPEVLIAEPVKVLASENDVLRVSEGYLVSPMAH